MINPNTNNLAEKIALLLQEGEKESGDFAALRSSLEAISRRLGVIESKLETGNSNETRVSAGESLALRHPSQAQYLNLAELADEIINGMQNEKACPYEPTGKPCDQCAMCNSHGF